MNIDEGFDLEREKLQVEKDKLKWEEEKLKRNQDFEREKSKIDNGLNFKNIIPGISVVVSVVILVLTLNSNFQIQKMQNEIDLNLANVSANNDFQLKAAEIAMDSDSPVETLNKAVALKKLFKDKLPENFAEDFNATEIGGPNKKKLFDTLSEHPENREQILQDWIELWPDDRDFINNLTPDKGTP